VLGGGAQLTELRTLRPEHILVGYTNRKVILHELPPSLVADEHGRVATTNLDLAESDRWLIGNPPDISAFVRLNVAGNEFYGLPYGGHLLANSLDRTGVLLPPLVRCRPDYNATRAP